MSFLSESSMPDTGLALAVTKKTPLRKSLERTVFRSGVLLGPSFHQPRISSDPRFCMAKISETIVETNLAGGPLTLADVAFEDNGSSPRRIGTLSIGCRELADARIAF